MVYVKPKTISIEEHFQWAFYLCYRSALLFLADDETLGKIPGILYFSLIGKK